jgi:hypothetical protein
MRLLPKRIAPGGRCRVMLLFSVVVPERNWPAGK